MKKLVFTTCFLLVLTSFSATAQWEIFGNTATANDYLGTNNNFPLEIYTAGQQQMALSSTGRLSLDLSSSSRFVHIHDTRPILAEMGSQLPAPAGSESLIVLTNTKSGSTAWDGLRIGLVGSVAQVSTLDKIRLDVANDPATISLKYDGKINYFNLGGSYDAKIGSKSTNENAFYIDNSSNQNGYALKIKVTDNSTQAISLVKGNNGKFSLFGDGRMSLGTSSPQPNFMLDVNGAAKIGSTTVVDYSLDVIGKIRACEVRVSDPGWCDFVFDLTYNLQPLENLDQYVQEHHHLPEVPT
jgi:hypothetical protein